MLHIFKSNLVGKEKLFDLLAISHATGYPVLFEGEKGTAKTQAAIDYMSGFEKNKLFKLELTEGTRISELKGFLDLNALINEKVEKYNSTLSESDAILINEVDKANSSIRNAMLGLMAEKKLMYGREVIDCNYKLFIGTCNVINTDEEEEPFWDRFILKYKVNRLSVIELASNANLVEQIYIYDIPESGLDNPIDESVFITFINEMYSSVSDRTLYKSIKVINAIKQIFKVDDTIGCLLTAMYINPTAAINLNNKFSLAISKESTIKKIDKMYDGTVESLQAIKKHISVLESTKSLSPEIIKELKSYVNNFQNKFINV